MFGAITPAVPYVDFGVGVSSPAGVQLHAGARVAAYVCSAGRGSYPGVPANVQVYSTLASALSQCEASRCNVIHILPGHTESVTDNTMLTNLLAGTTIIGHGHGTLKPTFRFTATASQWVIDDANCQFHNLFLRLEGANGVVKAINITGANTLFSGCKIQVASGASNKSTIAIEVGTGADFCTFANCYIYGTATHNVTDGFKIVAAVDGFTMFNCVGIFSATAGNGNVHFTAAATNVYMERCSFYNTHTSSTANIALDDVAVDGFLVACDLAQKNDGTVTDQGVTFGSNALVQCSRVFAVDSAKKNSILSPVVET
jgi:hypothetical protein